MAEAAVEDRPPQRFYCHMCNVQFENASTNYTCPHCSNGFIEELESSADNPEEIIDITDSDDDNYQMLNYGPLDFLSNPQEERHIGRARYALDPTRRRRYASVHPRSRIRPRTLTRLASTHLRQHTPFENLIQEFIVNLGVGVNWGGGGNMQVFLGNPGDYAWGREGLDAIVTQLLNQMDTSDFMLPDIGVNHTPKFDLYESPFQMTNLMWLKYSCRNKKRDKSYNEISDYFDTVKFPC